MWAFSSTPKAVASLRGLHKNDSHYEAESLNIMSDPGVLRGTTSALSSSQGIDVKDRAEAQGTSATTSRKGYQTAVDRIERNKGRSAEEVSTSDSLQEHEQPPATSSVTNQTDPFSETSDNLSSMMNQLHQPSVVLSASTSMLYDKPFHFETEVCPLLDVLVGKSLHQAVLEIEQENELQATNSIVVKLSIEQQIVSHDLEELASRGSTEITQQQTYFYRSSNCKQQRDSMTSRSTCDHVMRCAVPRVLGSCNLQPASNDTRFSNRPTAQRVFQEFLMEMCLSTTDEVHNCVRGHGMLDLLINDIISG